MKCSRIALNGMWFFLAACIATMLDGYEPKFGFLAAVICWVGSLICKSIEQLDKGE